jgi:hypothetical protein
LGADVFLAAGFLAAVFFGAAGAFLAAGFEATGFFAAAGAFLAAGFEGAGFFTGTFSLPRAGFYGTMSAKYIHRRAKSRTHLGRKLDAATDTLGEIEIALLRPPLDGV